MSIDELHAEQLSELIKKYEDSAESLYALHRSLVRTASFFKAEPQMIEHLFKMTKILHAHQDFVVSTRNDLIKTYFDKKHQERRP